MKTKLNGFLIFEGIADKAFLSQFLDCEIICLGGYNMPRGTLDYAQQLLLLYQGIVLCDPDDAGRYIDSKVTQYLTNTQSVLVKFKNRNNFNKTGIAETTKESVLLALKDFVIDSEDEKIYFTVKDALDLNLNNAKTRQFLQKRIKIGQVNFKTTIKRINYLKLTKDDVEKVLKEYDC